MTIGEKILTLRKGRGLSQEQLAEVLGVSRQAVSKWESEQSVPDIDKIVAVADYFEVTTDYLLYKDAEATVTSSIEVTETESQENAEYEVKKIKNRKIQMALEAIAVALYILCVTPILILQDELGVVLMFVIIAIATGLIIFSTVFKAKTKSKEEKREKEKKPENPKLKSAKKTIRTIFVVLYFIVSFATGAWHITWVIFLISSAVTNIADTIPELKEDEKK